MIPSWAITYVMTSLMDLTDGVAKCCERLDVLEKTSKDHEERIAKLESKVFG